MILKSHCLDRSRRQGRKSPSSPPSVDTQKVQSPIEQLPLTENETTRRAFAQLKM